MKISTIICFALFLLGVLLFLAQMWFHIFDMMVFPKIMITIGALFAVAVVALFLVRENQENRKINDDSSLK